VDRLRNDSVSSGTPKTGFHETVSGNMVLLPLKVILIFQALIEILMN